MHYQTYNPDHLLAPFIRCYWTIDAADEGPGNRQRIVPDGCMELIFHYGDLYRQYLEDGSSIIQPRCFVFGQITAPLDIEPTGATGIFAARFQPDGLAPFLRIPAKELQHRAVTLEKAFGDTGAMLEQAMLLAGSTSERIQILEHFLQQQLQDGESASHIVRSCVAAIWGLHGQHSIEELSEQLKLHRRQLERKCLAATGLSPKQLSRIARLQQTLYMMQQQSYHHLTGLAYENNYYDQAHFIKEFRAFTGVSPTQFFGPGLEMSALFRQG